MARTLHILQQQQQQQQQDVHVIEFWAVSLLA
jgi:hypothetical protein